MSSARPSILRSWQKRRQSRRVTGGLHLMLSRERLLIH